jgi:hypothetical protein
MEQMSGETAAARADDVFKQTRMLFGGRNRGSYHLEVLFTCNRMNSLCAVARFERRELKWGICIPAVKEDRRKWEREWVKGRKLSP